MTRHRERLRLGHPMKQRDSGYVAMIIAENQEKIYRYSLPEYRDKQLCKLKEYILKKFTGHRLVYIYDISSNGIENQPIIVLNTQKGNIWQPFEEFNEESDEASYNKLYEERQKSNYRQKHIHTTHQNWSKSLGYEPKYNLWMPLKPEYRRGNYKGHQIGSIDIDPQTGEQQTDRAAIAGIVQIFFKENWAEKISGTALLYRNNNKGNTKNENKEIGYLSIKDRAIYYSHTKILVGSTTQL